MPAPPLQIMKIDYGFGYSKYRYIIALRIWRDQEKARSLRIAADRYSLHHLTVQEFHLNLSAPGAF